MTDMENERKETLKQFRESFVENNPWKSESGDTAFVAIGNIEKFLENSLIEQEAKIHARLMRIKPHTCMTHYGLHDEEGKIVPNIREEAQFLPSQDVFALFLT